ncbi:MAG: SDR family oxidoreductase [Deltaproteobacteria bacterium]|nr:SDR family oxidoreductase [Deltaproteobacteria bacterium]
MNLHGANVLITGGAHRLGRAIGLRLAEAGANVAFTYLASADAARQTQRELEQRGARALALRADAADDRQVARVVSRVRRTLGGIDLFVANAGVFRRTPLAAATPADWDDMLRLNFAVMRVPALRVGALMRRQGHGAIVALTDISAHAPWADYLPYCIAKRAVAALTVQLARRLAPAVRVNAIAPGPVLMPDDFPAAARRSEIRRTLLRREGSAADIAAAVQYLAEADYVTGVVLPVDGGRRFG